MELLVKKRNGRLESLNTDKINECVERACESLEDVSASEIVLDAGLQLYNKIPTVEIDKALILSAKSKIEKEPNYSYVTARLLLNVLYKEVLGKGITRENILAMYRDIFIKHLKKLVKEDRIDEKLIQRFDLDRLAESLKPERDLLFKYLGIQTLYDRYFIHLKERRMETPQAFFMRVAMGLSLNEADPTSRAIEFYEEFSQFNYLPSTPTLFNSGTTHPQLSSCYVSTIEDSIDGIFGTIHGQARLSKYAGGLGVDWTPVRSTNSYIKGTNGKSTGVVPWLKVYNDMLLSVDQGGKRKGAGVAYLESWHGDIEEFFELRKNTGDERRRCHDMHTAHWVCDEFLSRVERDEDWYLFSPSDCSDLHELYGGEFSARYRHYIQEAEAGLLPFHKVKAKDLWKKNLTALFETGHPWITFKDASNLRYSDVHVGTVHSGNLCVEFLRHTIPTKWNNGKKHIVGETATCNLCSINLASHIVANKLDFSKLAKTVRKAIRGADNIIDINFYPTEEAENSNLKHRPVGLGTMGWHDVVHAYGLEFGSDAANKLSCQIQEVISWNAIDESCNLAAERGSYSTFVGSTWSRGILPIDTYEGLMAGENRLKYNYETTCDWAMLREKVRNGIRNANMMAIAPTATISYIAGCSQSIEPDFSALFVYTTLSGNFTMVNEWFVREMKKLGLWSPTIVDKLKQHDGDVKYLEIPDSLKRRFATAFDVPANKLIEGAAARQIWIDMGQSLNLYLEKPSLKALSDMYMLAWKMGLKTTYYLRTKAASKIEKNAVAAPVVEVFSQVCDRSDPNCESCQ